MAQLLEYIKLALMNIKANKVRTILTMLGIIIGVSSVIMIVSVGNGISAEVTGALNDIAGGQMYVYANNNNQGDIVEFDNDDIEAIKDKIAGIRGASSLDGYYGEIETKKGQLSAYVQAGNCDVQYYFSDPIIAGRFFTEDEYQQGKKVCILDEKSAINLFGTTDVIGMSFELQMYRGIDEYTIIGVRKSKASKMYDMLYMPDQVEMQIPTTAFVDTMFGSISGMDFSTFDGFYIFTEATADAQTVTRQIISLLEARHNVRGENMIMVEDFNSYLSEINNIMGYITLFVVFVAGISLLVGGIGVMTIMLVSVTERTREIGIRKALGARTGSIMFQFLCESAFITLIAGVIGIIIGSIGGLLLGKIAGFQVVVSPGIVIFASLFSSAVGLFFGIYPARKAAKLSPIDALRHE